jgi:DNA-binding NarL/FixJ family response regulator
MHVPKIRVLLADDHPAMLTRVASLLESSCQIVGSATNGREAVEIATQERPEVILLDISMPVMNGIEAAGALIQGGTDAKIIFLTVHDDPDFVKAALATGASGYVVKSRIASDLIPAILEALEGHRFVSPSFLAKNSNSH